MSTEHVHEPPKSSSAGINDPLVVPVHQEEILLGTKQVETGGGVRVEKTVVEHPQIIDESLRREEIEVRHVPVNRIVHAADVPTSRYEGDTLIVPVLEEIVVIEKRLRIKEELHISKIVRTEPHSETVMLKSEEVSIHRFDERRNNAPGESDIAS
jgi:stress response protein YsnF